MIEKEVESVLQAEQQCRDMIKQAEYDRADLIKEAQKDAKRQYEELVRVAHQQGEAQYNQVVEVVADSHAQTEKELKQKVQAQRVLGESRLEHAVNSIWEGMWKRGNRTDVQI